MHGRVQADAIPSEVIPRHHHQITQQQYAALEVIALSFAVHVTQQKDAQNHRDHVPLREQERKSVPGCFNGVGGRHWIDCREENESWDLQEADLKGVGRTNFHGQGDVAVHSEGDGVLGIVLAAGKQDWVLTRFVREMGWRSGVDIHVFSATACNASE